MKLPKELTTVTRLSKTLALITFILFPIIFFFLGMQYQQNLDLVQEPTISLMPTKNIPTITSNTPESSCNTDTDCRNGAICKIIGPISANQKLKKVCVQKGQAVPL